MLRSLACLTLCFLLFFIMVWPATAQEANVFVYHRFGDERFPSTNISTDTFAAQLKFLKEKKYNVLPLGEVLRRLRAHEALPKRCASLTVDDAYETFLTGAMPLLRQYGFQATLFVSTDSVGSKGYLDWEALKELSEEGIEIGNHSASHPYFLDHMEKASWRLQVKKDLQRSQKALEQRLGNAPILFAYPFGEFSPELIEVVQEVGFLGAVAQQSGVVSAASNLFALPRFPMGGPYATLEGFKQKLAMKALPVQVLHPESSIITDTPPTLVVQIGEGDIDLSSLRCFIGGHKDGVITPDPEVVGRFSIKAAQPLAGRRNKYTLTAPGKKAQQWYWFSQLWVNPLGGWPRD